MVYLSLIERQDRTPDQIVSRVFLHTFDAIIWELQLYIPSL